MTLNIDAQKVLDKILIKTIPELLSEEIAFLRARRSYLNDEQLEFYKDILSDEVNKKVSDDGESSYNDLQKEAFSLGMKNVVGKSKKILTEFINKAYDN